MRGVAVPLFILPIFAAAAFWQGMHSHRQTTNESSWPTLIASMHRMHAATASLESSGDSDIDFVKVMLPHHEAALDMAKTELLYGKDPQMRRLAEEIITDQKSEMDLMRLWMQHHEAGARK